LTSQQQLKNHLPPTAGKDVARIWVAVQKA
jgi:hypothetical protein